MRPRRRRSVPRWLPPVLVVAADAALLLSAFTVGLRIPGLSLLGGVTPGSGLDYTSRVGPLSALSANYVAEVLGWEGWSGTPAEVLADGGEGSETDTPPGGGPLSGPDVHPATNDDFEDARPVRSVPYEARTTSEASSREQGEPAGCAPPLGGTLWYQFTPDKSIGLVADTFGSDHPTTLAVYSGDSLASLAEVVCNTDVRGLALVQFPGVAGERYFFQVSAPTRDVDAALGTGRLVFRLGRQGTTSLASVGEGGQSNAESVRPSISAEGRHVVFLSGASNLDRRYDTYCPSSIDCGQLHVRDLARGATRMVSISSQGVPGNGPSGVVGYGLGAAISADGRFIAFDSFATNLVEGDTNICTPANIYWQLYPPRPGSCPDVFVHDRDVDGDGRYDEEGEVETTRVSVSSSGAQADDISQAPAISPDGRFVVFASMASNLVENDYHECRVGEAPYLPYNCADVYVHDRETGRTSRVSVSSAGEPGNADSGWSLGGSNAGIDISSNGRYVAFMSRASNLVPGATYMCKRAITWTDPSNCSYIFVHDRVTGRTTRVSVSSDGEPSNASSYGVSISGNGRYVAFASSGSNLVRRDRQTCGTQQQVTCGDVFVHDRDADGDGIFDEPRAISTVMASVSTGGEQAETGAGHPVISDDGSSVAFTSASSNLVEGDENGSIDVFVRDLRNGVTKWVSVSSDGAASGDVSNNTRPGISADGRIFTWSSQTAMAKNDQSPFWDVFVHRFRWTW